MYCYELVAVVSRIGVVNIVNTITTNLFDEGKVHQY